MKSEVIEMIEMGSGDYRQLEIKLRVENDDGEILPEYGWMVNAERTAEVLSDEDELKDELALATKEALDYIKRDKTMVQNAKIEEKKLDLDKVLTAKVKKGLTKKGIEDSIKKMNTDKPIKEIE